MNYPTEDCWIVEVKTDSYAGNFERAMTAFCTGHVGNCEVGNSQASRFHSDIKGFPFENIINYVPGDYGCSRPCSMGGDDNKSVLMFFNTRPDLYQQNIIESRARMFGEETNIQIKGFRLFELNIEHVETDFQWKVK